MSDWYAGRYDTASATLAEGRIVVRVEGTLPAPCFDAELREYARDPGGTEVRLALYWRAHPRPCPLRDTPFAAAAEVALRGAPPATVRIFHADTFDDVPVGG